MSEKNIISQANIISIPTIKKVLEKVPSLYPKRDGHHQIQLEIKHPGADLETIVTKLITHIKENY